MFVRICVLLLVSLTCHVLGEKLKSLDEAIKILGELVGENLLIDLREPENDNAETSPEETDDILEKREHEDTNSLVVPHKAHVAIGRDTETRSRKSAADESDRLDTKLSAYNAFARKAHQGVVGRKGKTEPDNWVFVEVPVKDKGDVLADNTQGGNRLAAYDALRRGNNRVAAYDGLRKSGSKLAAYDGLRKGGNRLAAYDALRQGVGKAAAHDALGKDENKVTAHDGLNKVAPHDALCKVAPHDALGKVAPDDALGKVAPHDALGKVAPHDALGKAAPHDALNRVAPHEAQKRKSEEGSEVIKTKIVAFKV